MITKFKLFESRMVNPNKNPVSWNGKPFWIGIVDLRDAEIIATWTYEHAKSHDFHHSFYMDREYQEKLDDGEYGIFWVNKNKDGTLDLDCWGDDVEKGVTVDVYNKLKKKLIK